MDLPKFYPILDTNVTTAAGLEVVPAARAILDGGAGILQFRHKGHFSREVFAWAEQLAAMCQTLKVPFVLNDRADLAALLQAGVHVGQEDLSPVDVRTVVPPGTMVGFSTHNSLQFQASESEPVDYVALGPIFATRSKRNPDPVVGLQGLRQLSPLTARPVVAIGGIRLERASEVWDAGAASIALIGDLFLEVQSYADLRIRVATWRKLCDMTQNSCR